MHVTVTTTKGPPGQPLEVATLAGEAMFPWLSEIEGFEGLLMMSNESDGTTLVITFWESKEVADEHLAVRAEFRDRITATVDVHIDNVVDYDLTFANLGTWPADTLRKRPGGD